MKKFLSIISLVLVVLMIAAMPAVYAEETAEPVLKPYTIPEGINVHYAKNVSDKPPVINGTISEGEYGEPVRIDNPRAANNENWGETYHEGEYDRTLASEYVEFYYAYDDNYIYIALYDHGPEYIDDGDEFKLNNVPFRHNYRYEIFPFLDDVTGFLQFGTNKPVYFEFGSAKANFDLTYFAESIDQKIDLTTGDTVGFGDILMGGNVNYANAKWAYIREIKIDRAALADMVNQLYFTDYDALSNAFYFEFTTNGFRAEGAYKSDGVTENLEPVAPTQYFKWNSTDVSGKQGNYEAYGLYDGIKRVSFPSLIVLAEEGEDIYIADPFPPRPEIESATEDTEPVADDSTPVADDSTPIGDDTAASTEPTAGGCGGAVSFAGIALVAALGTCTAFLAKKKED